MKGRREVLQLRKKCQAPDLEGAGRVEGIHSIGIHHIWERHILNRRLRMDSEVNRISS